MVSFPSFGVLMARIMLVLFSAFRSVGKTRVGCYGDVGVDALSTMPYLVRSIPGRSGIGIFVSVVSDNPF